MLHNDCKIYNHYFIPSINLDFENANNWFLLTMLKGVPPLNWHRIGHWHAIVVAKIWTSLSPVTLGQCTFWFSD